MRRKILAAAAALVLAVTTGSDGGGNCVDQLGRLNFIALKQQRTGGSIVLRIYFTAMCPVKMDRGPSSDCQFLPRVQVTGYPIDGGPPVVLRKHNYNSRTLACGSAATAIDFHLDLGTPCASGPFSKVVFTVTVFPGQEADGRGTTWTQTLNCLATNGPLNPGPNQP